MLKLAEKAGLAKLGMSRRQTTPREVGDRA
jgi:hypothetical protein